MHPAGHIAIIGSGVAGLTAAHLLSRRFAVTLYEADSRPGGHAHTHDIDGTPVDTGFIVFNDRTYPTLIRLFGELDVPVQRSDMSMSVTDERTRIELAGGRGLGGLIGRPQQIVKSEHRSVLATVPRMHRLAKKFLAETAPDDTTTYGEFLREARISEAAIRLYAVPVVACVWSMPAPGPDGRDGVFSYPARYLFQFLDHHGLLDLVGAPPWYTVKGGSRTYVRKILDSLPDVRLGSPVTSVRRTAEGAEVIAGGQRSSYDRVVIATHPDQALRLLSDATETERDVLGSFRYARNETVLHTDASLLPRTPWVRASWNYRTTDRSEPLATYWMNRLQRLDRSKPLLVTLNGADRVDPRSVLAVMDYEHPQYDVATVRAQRRLPSLRTNVTAFAGAYHGWGFHEDGAASGAAVARAWGVPW
ncbi:MAG TPA: FAD-dependent oxidoreductase [Propionibacteriaceae bacterium]|nr:FAD-dependent oxidoreductase [Propionibacteriaceae bacterium]